MEKSTLVACGVACVLATVLGLVIWHDTGTQGKYSESISKLQANIDGSQREISELRRLTSESLSTVKVLRGSISGSREQVGEARVLVSGSIGSIDSSLSDLDYVTKAIEGLGTVLAVQGDRGGGP